jgi:glycosyltransferase involved in cell wall biosynthesis
VTSHGPLSSVSLVVVTLDEEVTIARCIGSVPGAGETIVVDSFSRDSTVAVALEHGARVFLRPFASAADQKNWAIGKAEKEWILLLDADESVSPELLVEIASAVRSPRADGYWLRRRSEFFGKTIRFCGWGDERVLRLFRRGAGRYAEREVHERLSLDGSVSSLAGFIEHRPYRDISDYIDRMKSYSRRGAIELHKNGTRWFPGVVTHPIARFIRMYFLQLGMFDGGAGLLLCGLAAASVFFKYAALRELSAEEKTRKVGGRG